MAAVTARDLALSEVEGLTRALVDIDSTTGREQEVGGWLSAYAVLRRPDVFKVGVAGAVRGRAGVVPALGALADEQRHPREERRQLQ